MKAGLTGLLTLIVVFSPMWIGGLMAGGRGVEVGCFVWMGLVLCVLVILLAYTVGEVILDWWHDWH